jgi:hypothetical protein
MREISFFDRADNTDYGRRTHIYEMLTDGIPIAEKLSRKE